MHWKTALRRCYIPFAMCLSVACIAIHFLGLSVYIYPSNQIGNFDSQSIESFHEVTDRLPSEKWKTYNNQEKLDILQVVCDYECEKILGCSSPKVAAGHLEHDTICGSYRTLTKTIIINVEHLANDPEEEVLDTLLHEARHVYQHATVDAFNAIEGNLSEETKGLSCFKTIESYRDNFEHYVNGNRDYDSYYDQEIENDSRSWAEWRIRSEYYYYLYPLSDVLDTGLKQSK